MRLRIMLVAAMVAAGVNFCSQAGRAQDKEAAPTTPVDLSSVETPAAGYQMLPYFQADAIIMHRTQGNFDLGNFNWAEGPRFVVGRPFGDASALEFGYFSIQSMNQSAFLPDPLTGPIGTSINNRETYHSFMQSAEVSLRHWLTPEFSVLAGFRYVNWHENLGVASDPVNPIAPGTMTQNYHTSNSLYGFQVGGDWKSMLTQRFGLEVGGKAGVFGAESDFDANATVPGFGPLATGGNRTRASFVGELGVVGTYNLTDYLKLRAGYQVMWIEGLALAPDQISGTNFLGASPVNNHGGVFLHGAVVGLELRW